MSQANAQPECSALSIAEFCRAVPSTFRMHVGGEEIKEGWHILNARPEPFVDILGNILELGQFPDQCCDEIYASHVLEHIDYMYEVSAVMRDFYRMLKPGGTIYISVPDMGTLCHMYVDPTYTLEQRYAIMRMIYGGHINKYDYHYGGFDFEILGGQLFGAGFREMSRVTSFNLFQDTSQAVVFDRLISLNMIAKKPV